MPLELRRKLGTFSFTWQGYGVGKLRMGEKTSIAPPACQATAEWPTAAARILKCITEEKLALLCTSATLRGPDTGLDDSEYVHMKKCATDVVQLRVSGEEPFHLR
jgi:hypothetical protein